MDVGLIDDRADQRLGLGLCCYGAILGHLLAAALGLMVRRRKLLLQMAFGPPLMIGTLAVVLFHQI